jgi:hypothetical protein
VGGGYPEAESGLAKNALQWMLSEAKQAGLLVDAAREDLVLGKAGAGYVRPDSQGPMHESLTGAWRSAEFVPKRHYDWDRKEERRRMRDAHRVHGERGAMRQQRDPLLRLHRGDELPEVGSILGQRLRPTLLPRFNLLRRCGLGNLLGVAAEIGTVGRNMEAGNTPSVSVEPGTDCPRRGVHVGFSHEGSKPAGRDA